MPTYFSIKITSLTKGCFVGYLFESPFTHLQSENLFSVPPGWRGVGWLPGQAGQGQDGLQGRPLQGLLPPAQGAHALRDHPAAAARGGVTAAAETMLQCIISIIIQMDFNFLWSLNRVLTIIIVLALLGSNLTMTRQ